MARGSHFEDDYDWGQAYYQARGVKRASPSNDYRSRVAGGQYMDDGYIRKRKKRRRKRRAWVPVLVFVLVFLLALAAALGVCGYTLYNQAQEVKAQAKEVVALVESMPDAITSRDTTTLDSTTSQVVTLADEINATVHGPLWNMATYIPVYGTDVKSAQTLGDTLVSLANDALVPIAQNLKGTSLSDLFSERRVNVEKLTALANAVTPVIPVVEEAAATMDALPEAHIQQVADYIEKVREPLNKVSNILTSVNELLPLLPNVFGAGGTRTYFVIAQKQAELRSTGGMPGAVGFVTVTNGYIEVGDFGSVASLSNYSMKGYVSETEEEYNFFFGVDLYKRYAELTFLPEFERVGQLTLDYCANYWPGVQIDGVVAVTPTFLQYLMAMTGSSVEVQGVMLDGNTTAQVLNHDVYNLYENDEAGEKSDEFFSEAADAAVDAVFANFGGMSLGKLSDLLTKSSGASQFFMWMANAEEQQAVRKLSLSGNLDYTVEEPQLGVYLNDYTVSAIDWYLGCTTYVGNPVQNADGTVTYDVVTYVTNYLTNEEAEEQVDYITGYRGAKYSRADIMTRIYLFAPYGGRITDVQISYSGEGEEEYAESMARNYGERSVWNHTGWCVQVHTLAQSTNTISYKVTCAAGLTQQLNVRQTPMANQANGTVIYAWEQ